MDNFGLFKKNELSHILNNESEFGARMIGQIEEYCVRKRYSIKEIKNKTAKWSHFQNGLIFELRTDQIFILKTEEAKKGEVRLNHFIKITFGIFLIFLVWECISSEYYDFYFFQKVVGIIFLTILLIGLFKQGKKIEAKSNQLRWIELVKPNLAFLKENSSIIIKGEVKAINLFWTEDQEAGSVPNAKLELKINAIKSILISSGDNYLEIFKNGNEISKLLNKKLNIFYGECPIKKDSEL